MSLDEIREKHFGSTESANEAFNELCAMVEALEVSSAMNFVLKYDLKFEFNF